VSSSNTSRSFYRGTDKSSVRPGRKKATAREEFDFHYFQIANVVDCLSSWYKFIMKQAHGGEFATFIVGILKFR
jgi:hypothetical protein